MKKYIYNLKKKKRILNALPRDRDLSSSPGELLKQSVLECRFYCHSKGQINSVLNSLKVYLSLTAIRA